MRIRTPCGGFGIRPLSQEHTRDCSGRPGIRTPIPKWGTALAPRPGQPYPAAFRIVAAVSGRLHPDISHVSSLRFTFRHGDRDSESNEPRRRGEEGAVGSPFRRPAAENQWTRRESNPNFRCAKPVSSRWTTSPKFLLSRTYAAEAVGLEPTGEPCSPPVFETGSSSGRMTSVHDPKHCRT